MSEMLEIFFLLTMFCVFSIGGLVLLRANRSQNNKIKEIFFSSRSSYLMYIGLLFFMCCGLILNGCFLIARLASLVLEKV